MANTLHEIAQEIFEDEFIDHDDVTQAGIKMWLRNNLGTLNIFIDTDFEIIDEIVSPVLKYEEKAILKEMYLERYYHKIARSSLKGALSAATTEWIIIKEGDTTFTRANKNELVKSLRGFANDHRDAKEYLIRRYNAYQTHPIEVNIKSS